MRKTCELSWQPFAPSLYSPNSDRISADSKKRKNQFLRDWMNFTGMIRRRRYHRRNELKSSENGSVGRDRSICAAVSAVICG